MPADRHGNERIALTDDDLRYLGQDDDDTIQQGYSFYGVGYVADESQHPKAREIATDKRDSDYLRFVRIADAILTSYANAEDEPPVKSVEELWTLVAIEMRSREPKAMEEGEPRRVLRRAVETAWRAYLIDGGDVRAAFQWRGWMDGRTAA